MQGTLTHLRTQYCCRREYSHPLHQSANEGWEKYRANRTVLHFHPSSNEYTDTLDKYLYEPNASILKAGAFRNVACIYKVKKLHPNSHLYTSGEPIKNFPGRSFRITGICTLNKKELKSVLGDLKKANITVRNFPSSVAELRKRIKLSEGGEVYLFATTLINEQKVLIRCEKI